MDLFLFRDSRMGSVGEDLFLFSIIEDQCVFCVRNHEVCSSEFQV